MNDPVSDETEEILQKEAQIEEVSDQESELIETSDLDAIYTNVPEDESTSIAKNPIEEEEDDNEEYEEDEESTEDDSSVDGPGSLTNKDNSTEDQVKVGGNYNQTVAGSNVFDSFNYHSGGDLSFSCHNCQSTVKSKDYGKIECKECSAINYRYNLNDNIHVTEFKTLSHSPDDHYRFKKLLSKISNAIIGKAYHRAYHLCVEASEVAPGESVVWELFAQADYFARTRGQIRPKQGYTPHDEIINIVKTHLKRAKFHSRNDEYIGGEVVAGEIAEDITNNTRSKLGQFKRKKKKGTNEKMYSKVDLRECGKLLPQFKTAYKLSGSTYHLKAYVEELSKEYKWIIEKLDGSLAKMPNVARNFNPVKERRYYIEMIQNFEPDYPPPEILKERLAFDFSSMESPEQPVLEEIPGLTFEEE